MLALVLTFILALYVLGPDLFSRWLVGYFAPARIRNRSRSEEISSGLFGSLIPIVVSFVVIHSLFHHFNDISVLRTFFSGAYSEKLFDANPSVFFASLRSILKVNIQFLGIIYFLELAWSALLVWLIKHYGPLLRKYEKKPYVSLSIAHLVRPWTAEWHLKLSGMLLEKKTDYIQVDVLTKMNILYRGRMIEYDLSAEGSLVSITLENTKKFKRDELLEARKLNKSVMTTAYWSSIEGRMFVIMATEVITLNLNYISQKPLQRDPTIIQAASKVLEKVKAERIRRSSNPPL